MKVRLDQKSEINRTVWSKKRIIICPLYLHSCIVIMFYKRHFGIPNIKKHVSPIHARLYNRPYCKVRRESFSQVFRGNFKNKMVISDHRGGGGEGLETVFQANYNWYKRSIFWIVTSFQSGGIVLILDGNLEVRTS